MNRTPPFDLASYLRARQTLVDAHLETILAGERDVPRSLIDAMRYSLLAPGKRLRPCLVFMACAAAGGRDNDALPAACAVEMIHTYSLIHDDLPAMDDDDLRRGRPTCHKQFGEALAILAGDALLTLAFQVLAQRLPPHNAGACCLELANGAGAAGMVGGQVEDLALEARVSGEVAHTVEALERIHAHKTGALFRACLQLGVLSAQVEESAKLDLDLCNRLGQFGQNFGLVFQITDDLLDVEGSAADTGKRTQKDAARGKLTYPGLLGSAESRRHAQQLADKSLELLAPLGVKGQPLMALLHFVLDRKR
jgi:geranylgeranyl diphosphate synthase type II